MTSVASFAGFGLALLASSAAVAQTQAEIAARENEEGKNLLFDGKYADASAKFQDAVARVPEPKYFFNLCTSRFQEGKFGEALTACNAADKNGDDKLKAKTAKLVEKIQEEAKKQGIDLQATGGGGGPGPGEMPPPGGDPNQPPVTDPNNPGGPAGGPAGGGYAVGRPPEVNMFKAAPPENKYTWSLGIDLFTGGGQIGQADYFGTAAGGFRLKGDYMLNPAARFGAQGYLQVTHFAEGEDQMGTGAQTLDVIDLGAAAYKHLCGSTARACFTPLAGLQLAMMSPAGEGDGAGSQVFNYAAIGARLELGFQYALGTRYEHVLGIHAGLNAYSAVFSEPMDGFTAAEWGLDKGGAVAYVGAGYTYRFQTPFGTAPFVTLE